MSVVVKDSIRFNRKYSTAVSKRILIHRTVFIFKVKSPSTGGSIKDRPAKNMIEAAVRQKKLKPGGTIVRVTAGNTGIALAIMAIKGYKMIVVVPDKMTIEKVYHLRDVGAEVVIF